ncbi:hypothetical protein G3I60_12005 [Streptomyces sp. SID13666]|uniref:helix-turn-helix transcriptional regulator n=1 Tax=unclassified Streptomyces TaxID=2593676 RepID=UPI0013C09C39|nr:MULTISPECIES: LuxR C-terminal-related transcriptional regulator [unclassified Streptomyces]NEA54850.1 hypothetical protein [Streptomyces sp. SID13666]NEA70652.1 hypothetical protein [Streptomyces sp. SID13588]
MAVTVRGGAAESDDVGLALYQALRDQGSCPPATAAARLGLTATEAATGWAELRELGLIRAGRSPEEVDPVDPDTALISLLDRQRAALQAQREELTAIVRASESLMERYRPAVQRDAAKVEVEIITGDGRKRQMVGDYYATLTTRSRSMHPGPLPPAEVLAESLQGDADMVKRGIRVQAIYTQGINSAPRQRKYLSELASAGVEVRLAPQVPLDLSIGDMHTAILAANPDNPSEAALLVRGTALVRTYSALYEDCWLRSVPYSTKVADRFDSASELTEQHRTAMRLLANGLTDERIARKLGISLRTVSRLVSEVMRYLQAESRFQAGVLAVTHGFI